MLPETLALRDPFRNPCGYSKSVLFFYVANRFHSDSCWSWSAGVRRILRPLQGSTTNHAVGLPQAWEEISTLALLSDVKSVVDFHTLGR